MPARDIRNSLVSTPTITAVGSIARVGIDTFQAVTVPVGANIIEFCMDGGTARYTIGGTTPTATLGLILTANQVVRYLLAPGTVVRAIGIAAGAFLNYQMFTVASTNVVLPWLRNKDN